MATDFFTKIDRLTTLYPLIPKKAGIVAVNFSKDRFRDQAWLDRTKHNWERRKDTRIKSGTLIRSGRLKRSIRIVRANQNMVIIGTDVPYAKIHNEGGTIDKVVQVKSHTRKAHTRYRKGRRESVSQHKVSAFTRNMTLTMPQRQFLGTSYTLERRIELLITADIMRCFR
ncbi:MAG: phage virion morphogenesis protein [Bacteroidales bacterium]|jgi:phage gpG-like protein|nr:phage virion morphogenesis protein [Bacteroidales bacterium]